MVLTFPKIATKASSAAPKFNKTTSGKLKRMDNYKKNETRKQERLHFERKLQSNLDQYVTRAVTELVYRVPEDAKAARPDNHGTPEKALADLPAVVGAGGGGKHLDSAHASAMSEGMEREKFPIPVEVGVVGGDENGF